LATNQIKKFLKIKNTFLYFGYLLEIFVKKFIDLEFFLEIWRMRAISSQKAFVCGEITYSKGRCGRNEAFHPSIHPVIHPWMASYNNPLQCEG
jgi:hypothetical protein